MEIGRDAEPATAELCVALVDRHASVRQAASEALEKVNPEMLELVLPIVADKAASVRVDHIGKVAGLSRDGIAAKPVVIARLNQLSPTLIKAASGARRTPVPQGRRTTHTSTLGSADEAIACIDALFAIGRDDKQIVDVILDFAIKCKSGNVRARAIELAPELETKDRKRVVAVLSTAVKVDEDPIKVIAANGLARIGRDAKSAIPALRVLKGSPSEQVRAAATEAVKVIENAVEN